MTGREHPAAQASTSKDGAAKKAKCQVAILTFEKWQCNHDKEHQTLT